MKKLAVLVLALAGLAAFAGTCIIKSTALTEINGDTTFGGEMANDSGANILNHKFAVAFIDKDFDLLDTKKVDGCLRSLQNGSSNFFSASTTKNGTKHTLARIEGPLTFGEVVNGDLTITDISAVRDGETLVVTGTLKNTDSDDLQEIRVCAVITNEDDNVVVVQRDNNDYDLDPNDTVDFSITITVPDDVDDVEHVDLWVDAENSDEDDQVTEPQSKLNNNVHTATPTATGTATATPTETPTATPGGG